MDVLQAEVQVEQQELALRQQVGRREQALLALRTVMGQLDLPPVRPAAVPAPVFDPAALDDEALVERAVTANGAVRREAAALRAADLGVDESRASYWPTLSADWSVGRYVQTSETESLFRLGGFGDELFSQFKLRLSLPFFNDVLGNRLAIARAEVERENRRDALRQARLEAETTARSALVTLRDRWQSLGIAERALAIAGEALELAREEYRLGVRTFEQLQ